MNSDVKTLVLLLFTVTPSSEKKWKEGIVKVACCTKTFGMGVDKRNVRFVFHVDTPGS